MNTYRYKVNLNRGRTRRMLEEVGPAITFEPGLDGLMLSTSVGYAEADENRILNVLVRSRTPLDLDNQERVVKAIASLGYVDSVEVLARPRILPTEAV